MGMSLLLDWEPDPGESEFSTQITDKCSLVPRHPRPPGHETKMNAGHEALRSKLTFFNLLATHDSKQNH